MEPRWTHAGAAKKQSPVLPICDKITLSPPPRARQQVELQSLMSIADVDGDGLIDYNEFVGEPGPTVGALERECVCVCCVSGYVCVCVFGLGGALEVAKVSQGLEARRRIANAF